MDKPPFSTAIVSFFSLLFEFPDSVFIFLEALNIASAISRVVPEFLFGLPSTYINLLALYLTECPETDFCIGKFIRFVTEAVLFLCPESMRLASNVSVSSMDGLMILASAPDRMLENTEFSTRNFSD
jgi:hypothetical protein